jgi:SOS-response transcriptional repressor LexA
MNGCTKLDPAGLLKVTPRSFALRVHDREMTGAGIQQGDVVIGEFTPEAGPGAIVAALVDGECVLKRLVVHEGQRVLVSDNPDHPNRLPMSELVIQGVVHTVMHRLA